MSLHGILFEGEPQPKLRSRTKQAVGLVFLWTVFCMHFNSGYRASLAMASINLIDKPGPSSIEDVKRVGIIYDVVPYLLKDYQGKVKDIQIEFCRTYKNCSKHIRRDPENMAIITSEMSIWSATPRHFLDADLRSILAKREKLASYFVSFLVNKGSPLLQHINRALIKSREFGLVRKTQMHGEMFLKLVVSPKT
ncbi:uncharacterized protein LOC127752243 [Frankliniella occidentalis]|uniref:Uncharacterized protein LOC127752243 n=1 Tax=Frankliniella occidentalis TaxID=133901 RepID=A0A9C6XD98_FRAOC|nr:uncharacterized protein LOC127752243 [Frankliniella occidentalis]